MIYITESSYTSQSWHKIISREETQMVAVQICLVKNLQRKDDETYCTILKCKKELIFVPSFIFIGSFLCPRCFRKEG